jgi:hypothetical protein
MAYSDFTLDDVRQQLGLRTTRASLFRDIPPIAPASWFTEAITRGRSQALISEKARSEFVVTPILIHCGDFVGENFAIYSGVDLDVDASAGLKGPCDFILGGTPPMPALTDPLMVLVEAKKGDIEAGIPQCAAQMVAARRFNLARKNPHEPVCGCVTTGTDWQFLRLEADALVIDTDLYYLTDVNKILGILVAIMKVEKR